MTDSKTITFNDVGYTKESIADFGIDSLLEIRNGIADALGISAIKAFKDQAAAESQTWKALERFAAKSDEPEAKPKKTPKPKKEPKERGLAKSAESKTVKRPTAKMFSTITKTGDHDGSQGRGHRWPNYKDGMTIVDVIETEGTEPWDVYSWVEQGIMKVTEPTEAEFAERKAAWYKKHGLTDPEEAKRLRAEERATAKVERDKTAAEKKEKREADKAAKAETREKAKADKAKAK